MILKRRTKSGRLRYGVRVDRAGKQLWLGTFASLAEARHAEARAKAESRAPSQMTCDRFCDHWLEGHKERVKASTHDVARTALRRFKADFKGIPLHQVTRIEAEKWARQNRWQTPVVITLMNAAVRAELIDRNPFAGLSHKGEGRKRIVPLSVEEVNQLAQAALEVHGPYGPMMRALTLFLGYTAMRPGEAFALEWGDLDFDAMRIRVERRVYKGDVDLPKSNRARTIVLPPPARDAILHLPRTDPLVFTGKRGGRLSQGLMAWYWQPIQARFPRKITPYHLRHAAAHYLYVTMSLPDRVVAAQLGHNDGGKLVREIYGHGDVGALEEIDRAFGNVVPLRRVGDG